MRCGYSFNRHFHMSPMLIVTLLLLSFVQHFANGEGWHECPFNKEECRCYDDPELPPGDPYEFRLVECHSKNGVMPKFHSTPDAKYNITTQFDILDADATQIPGGHFAAFGNIDYLRLAHRPAQPGQSAEIKWDERAFDGVRMRALFTDGLDGIIPPPKVINELNLKAIYVWHAPTAISFPEQAFRKSPFLKDVKTYYTNIASVSPKAFAGLESQLVSFVTEDSNSYNLVTDVGSALKGFKNIEVLDLINSSITEIKKTDFADMPKLRDLYLNANPISKIEDGAFSNGLNDIRCLDISGSGVLLSAIDLALFSDIQKEYVIPGIGNFNFFMSYAVHLKNLTTSVTTKFPKAASIYLDKSGLETIDPKVGDLLKNFPDLYIAITSCHQLKCESLGWMSKIDCPYSMNIDDAKCADQGDKSLDQYLQEIDPDSKCHASKPGQNPRSNNFILC